MTARYQADLVLIRARLYGGHEASRRMRDAYGDVVADVLREWRAARDRALEAGLEREQVWLIPASASRRTRVDIGSSCGACPSSSRRACRSWSARAASPSSARSTARRLKGAWAGPSLPASCPPSAARRARVHDVAAVRQALGVAREFERGEDGALSGEKGRGSRVLESLKLYLASRTFLQLLRDGLDIFLVYYIVYRALLVLRGTRAMQVGMGLGMVFVLYVVARVLELVTVLTIMGALISSMILIIVVVFQNDIRRGLQRVGSRAWFSSFARAQESKVIDEVVEAATELARHRIGALITFEQDANLDEFVGQHKGHDLDAQVSRELLVSLFIPEGVNKLHDGSVIVRNLRIAQAGVFFPMPEGRVVDPSFGSRHRAALGITEETDAVVVDRERGARHHQLLLQRQHRHEPRWAQAPQHAGSHLQPQGQEERQKGAKGAGRIADARRADQRSHPRARGARRAAPIRISRTRASVWSPSRSKQRPPRAAVRRASRRRRSARPPLPPHGTGTPPQSR